MPNILIVEDEAAIADTLVYALQVEGHNTVWLTLATLALEYVKQNDVDLLILDVGLPDMSGFEVCRRLRRDSDVPIIFLTARGSEVDRIVGLEIGADDYVVKPFSPREVAARVRTILKRTAAVHGHEAATTQNTNTHSSSPFAVDEERLQIHYRRQLLSLTRYEFRLLQTFISQPERVFTREQLLNSIGVPIDAGYERNVDGHIKTLRLKLRQVSPEAEPIQTHRGVGYSLSLTDA